VDDVILLGGHGHARVQDTATHWLGVAAMALCTVPLSDVMYPYGAEELDWALYDARVMDVVTNFDESQSWPCLYNGDLANKEHMAVKASFGAFLSDLGLFFPFAICMKGGRWPVSARSSYLSLEDAFRAGMNWPSFLGMDKRDVKAGEEDFESEMNKMLFFFHFVFSF